MNSYDKYSRFLARSVRHIFKNFLNDASILEVYQTQSREDDPKVAVEITGTMTGEIVINLPQKTLDLITRHFVSRTDGRTLKKNYPDVAGELANLVTGTFANQLQYDDHIVRLSAPEFGEDPILIKALYQNINLSFNSVYGGFDVDLYYKDRE